VRRYLPIIVEGLSIRVSQSREEPWLDLHLSRPRCTTLLIYFDVGQAFQGLFESNTALLLSSQIENKIGILFPATGLCSIEQACAQRSIYERPSVPCHELRLRSAGIVALKQLRLVFCSWTRSLAV
jgi:hypothetical protein